jgi:hypothetical protein
MTLKAFMMAPDLFIMARNLLMTAPNLFIMTLASLNPFIIAKRPMTRNPSRKSPT